MMPMCSNILNGKQMNPDSIVLKKIPIMLNAKNNLSMSEEPIWIKMEFTKWMIVGTSSDVIGRFSKE